MKTEKTPMVDTRDYLATVGNNNVLVEAAKPTDKRKEQFEQIAKQLAAKGTR